MSRRTLCALLLFLAAGEMSGQESPLTPALAARVDSVYSRFNAPGSPGCALGISQGGRYHTRGYGLASLELGVPITPSTVFDIGSVSKQFTAMSVVLLAQDGKLSLDDEIQMYVPEVPRYAQPVTIRQLLHHTSGLRDYIDVLGWSGISDEAVTTDADALLAISRQKGTNFAPGSEYLYSNSGFFLLSVIVKRASGRSLRDFAVERIFKPLGMIHTQYIDRHEMIVPGKAGSYGGGDGGGYVLALANWEQTGDGGVNTTVEDFSKWDLNFETGTVGGAAGLAEMQTTGVLTGGRAITYALGLTVDTYRGARRISHGGAWAGFRAHFLRFPEHKLSVVSLCNLATAGPGDLNQRVADLLLEGTLPPVEPVRMSRPVASSPWNPAHETLTAIAGTYHSDELLADWVVTVRGDSVFARAGLGPEVPLRRSGTDSFAAFGTRVTLVRIGDRVTGLTLNNRGLRDFRLSKVGAGQ